MDSLSRISSGLGVPLYGDECTTKVERISFERVLVEMDVSRELPKKLMVEDPNGRVFEHEVKNVLQKRVLDIKKLLRLSLNGGKDKGKEQMKRQKHGNKYLHE
ncbi:hypothetical protein H5410_027374 [Solanum commersonii]|uniref:Uncharacterized protein n=1 Tax=Solanum commersonii TaxID=4109 RepID=A0A9J5YZP0_SOLCO|nr:hypothetical protein H5410_027374 [Solanum commersonii]